MEALKAFLAMGGYAPYVWPAYGVTAAVMVALLVASARSLARRRKDLEALRRAREGESGQPHKGGERGP